MADYPDKKHAINVFPWDESFNTGIDEIDEQHQKLVFLLNKVADHIIFSGEATLSSIINELVDYAVYHIQSEEKHWFKILPDIPETAIHRDSHDYFIKRIHELKSESGTIPKDEWLETLLSFLASWMTIHILDSDKRMAILANAIQSGKSVEDARKLVDEQKQKSRTAIAGIIVESYKNLSASVLRQMHEIKSGNITQAKLHTSEFRLKQAMEYAQIGYWSITDNSQIIDWSPGMFRLFGLPKTAEPNLDLLRKIMKNGYYTHFLNSIQECFQTGKDHYVEYPIIRSSDGEMRWMECQGKVIRHDDGTPDEIAGFIQDITQRKNSERKITELAYYDPLTGLPNRRLLFDRLRQAIAACKRNNTNALLFFDIDNFKKVNDQYGHEYGDALLKCVALRVTKCIRASDTFARLSGDEFVVIISDLDSDQMQAATQAEIVATKLSDALSDVYKLLDVHHRVSVSIGITVFNDSKLTESEILKQADIAMYKAKQYGKNAICFYDPQMQDEINKQAEFENELRKAIVDQEFILHYQPQVDPDNNVIGAEALIRWQHPDKGLVGPNSFIPLAEKNGLIIPLGEWVIKLACEQLNLWQQKPETQHLTLSINVSAKQFSDAGFIKLVCQLIEEYCLPKGSLHIELTETMMVDNMDNIISCMNILKKKGVYFSLDDFGTGYSSLRYLKGLPLSQLKIDRSFVRDLESDSNDQSIVKTIISMSKALGLHAIAEGVETEKQREFLRNEGCSVFQGFLYSRPLPIDDFEMFLFK